MSPGDKYSMLKAEYSMLKKEYDAEHNKLIKE